MDPASSFQHPASSCDSAPICALSRLLHHCRRCFVTAFSFVQTIEYLPYFCFYCYFVSLELSELGLRETKNGYFRVSSFEFSSFRAMAALATRFIHVTNQIDFFQTNIENALHFFLILHSCRIKFCFVHITQKLLYTNLS